jgi:7-cyano-7-deazaguanine synthase
MSTNYSAVLFSAGLDSAVLVAHALAAAPAAARQIVALYVSVGYAWERQEREMAARLFRAAPFAGRVDPPVELSFDMRDVFPPSHWAMRGTPPASDTPDEDVYLDGRNVILLSKAAVYMIRRSAAAKEASITLMLGTLAGNPFADATPAFFAAMGQALSLGLGVSTSIQAPFAAMPKSDVIRRGLELGVPLELTMSCMDPKEGKHCGRCSKCRERKDAFKLAGVADLALYRV